MQIVDLSYDISEDIISWRGYPQPSLKEVLNITREGYQASHVSFMSHTGTHIDAPSHTLKGAPSLGELPVSHFFGKAVLIDLRGIEQRVEIGDLFPYAERIEDSKFAVFYCGHQQYWGRREFFYDYPVMTKEAAAWLCRFDLYGVGIDTYSIDPTDTKTSINHRIVASNHMIVIENMANLGVIADKTRDRDGMFWLSVFPIKYPMADGSPVRAVGFVPP